MLAQSMDKLYEQGIEQGIDQGIGKGMEQDKIETAQCMLDDGISIDIIAKYTELSEEAMKFVQSLLSQFLQHFLLRFFYFFYLHPHFPPFFSCQIYGKI